MVHTLLLYLKKEENIKLKNLISNIIVSILKLSTTPSQITEFMKTMRYKKEDDLLNFFNTLQSTCYILKNVFIK